MRFFKEVRIIIFIMEVFLKGHGYRYAAEQMLLTLYPEERPVYPPAPEGGDSVVLTLRRGQTYASVTCRLCRDGLVSRGQARVSLRRLTGPVETDRLLQRVVKSAFYRAALAGGHPRPVWGTLTGVRPAKLAASLLREEGSQAGARRRLERDFDVSSPRAELALRAARVAGDTARLLEPGDVCLYIGIPFCPTRCDYCSFVSVEAPRQLHALLPAYLAALEQELEATARAAREAGLRVIALYMGGGTPTTLDAEQLDRLLERADALFDPSVQRERTVEAGRPDTVTPEKLEVLRRRGVTRVSVNPQTMSDPVLAAIGRRHTVQDVYRAVEMVRAAGGFSLNMDLIAGLPGDTPGSFARTMEAVLALEPENVTVHTLALKKGSRFLTGRTPLPPGESVGAMLEEGNRRLAAGGYAPYYLYRQKFMSGSFENVGWAKPGEVNLYNVCMMEELTGILAAGAGGSTKLVGAGGALRRMLAAKYPREYIQRIDELCASKKEIPAFYRRERGERAHGILSVGD